MGTTGLDQPAHDHSSKVTGRIRNHLIAAGTDEERAGRRQALQDLNDGFGSQGRSLDLTFQVEVF